MPKILALLAILITLTKAGIVYPQVLIVDAVNEQGDGQYTVSLHSAGGYRYETATDIDDLSAGDVVAAILYCSGTPEDVQDDSIVTIHYSGFQQPVDTDADEVMLLTVQTS